jgi:hypothetical protein
MPEFKRATAEDGETLRELYSEFPDLDQAGLTDETCRSALMHAEGMVNALVADEDTDGRLWMDVPGAMDILQGTDAYLQRLWGECMSRKLEPELERVLRLLDRTSARLEKAADNDRRLRSAIDEHVAEGNIIIPHRKTRQHINRLLRDDER